MPLALFKPKPEIKQEEETKALEKEPIIHDASPDFSQSALKSLGKALGLAASLNSEIVSPFHLLKILSNTKEIKSVLSNLKADIADFNKSLDLHLQSVSNKSNYTLFSPGLKKILLLAHQISYQEGSPKVENSHLFYATIFFPETLEFSSKLNLDLKTIEEFLGQKKALSEETPALNRISKDLSFASFKNPSPFVGREKEVESIIRILLKSEKSNIILVGEHGVGKSAVVESLAQKIKTIPALSNSKIKSLDTETLFSSQTNLNNFGSSLIEESSTTSERFILVLDNISLLDNQGQVQALNTFLSHLLKNQKNSLILVASPAFYNEFLKNSTIINNYFEKITLEEPLLEDSKGIAGLKAIKIESYQKVKFGESAVDQAVELTKRYLHKPLPQGAIDLLEEAAAQKSFQKENLVSIDDIKKVVSSKTGIPLATLTVSEKDKLINLENILALHVIGQEQAVKKVSEAIRRSRSGLKDNKKPIGSFLFLGPTGVGKTELARNLAKIFYNDSNAFVRLDMSEFSEPHTTQRLIGSPPGYVGYEEGGQLTNPILEKPYSLILLDEIEKAHPKVFDIFLQILDDGRLTDSKGQTVDFKNTIIIGTSNIASEKIFELTPEQLKTFNPIPDLLNYFRPEFINRFDEIIVFNPLTTQDLIKIARLKIEELSERLKEKNIKIEVSDSRLEDLVKKSYNSSFGARPLERILRDKLENEIAKKLIDGSLLPGSTVKWE